MEVGVDVVMLVVIDIEDVVLVYIGGNVMWLCVCVVGDLNEKKEVKV